MKDNEETIVESKAQYTDEETIVDNCLRDSNNKTDAKNQTSTKEEKSKKGSNKVERAAAIAMGVGMSATAAAYKLDHPEPEPDPNPNPEPEVDHPVHHSQNTNTSQQQANVEVQPEQPTPEVVQQPEVVEVSPDDVQVLGVEHVQTESGEMNVGAMNVSGEDYYLVDVNNDNVFDTAWHDDNHDGIVQEVEVVDISEEGVRVDDFNQLPEDYGEENVTIETEPAVQENFFAENDYMDNQDIGQIDYLDNSDTSGLL